MIRVVRLMDVKSPWFLGGGVVSAVVLFFLFPWLFPGEAYRYEAKASWTESDPSRLTVIGTLHIRRPCPGSQVTSFYEFPDKTAVPAVRTGHIEHAMVGKSTVSMDVDRPGDFTIAMNFDPPEGATGISWRIRHSEACPDDAKRGIVEVGYVRIPPK